MGGSNINRRILCVDDEPSILSALSRVFSDAFEIDTATSGEEALGLLTENTRDYAVLMSDMRMPQMSGAVLMARASTLRPQTIRILLTGETDVDAAIAAVNDGAIFRFLTKPCPNKTLRKTLEAAVEQHALLRSEQELLEGTLRGLVKVLTDVLALVSPGVFARAARLKALVLHVADRLGLDERWVYEVAALLSPLGCIAFPDEIAARAFAGQELTDDERYTFTTHPETAYGLLSGIPRFERVAEIIRAQEKTGPLGLSSSSYDETVTMGITLLRAAIAVEERVAHGLSYKIAAQELRAADPTIPSGVILALESCRVGVDASAVKGLPIAQLTIGMITDEDVVATSGSVIVPKGTELGAVTLERLRKFAVGVGVREPVRVRLG